MSRNILSLPRIPLKQKIHTAVESGKMSGYAFHTLENLETQQGLSNLYYLLIIVVTKIEATNNQHTNQLFM